MRTIQRLFLPLLAGCLLVACSALRLPDPQTPAQSVYAAKHTFAAALVIANTYKNLPPCGGEYTLCSDQAVVSKLQLAATAAKATLDAAEETVRDPNWRGGTTDKAIVAASNALGAFVSITETIRSQP